MTIKIDPEQIQLLLKDAVREAVIAELPGLVRKALRKEYLTREEVKKLTGWSDRTLQHMRDERQIPFVQHGRKVLYPTKGIEAFLDRHKIRPRTDFPSHVHIQA